MKEPLLTWGALYSLEKARNKQNKHNVKEPKNFITVLNLEITSLITVSTCLSLVPVECVFYITP